MQVMVTLNQIRAARPCESGWKKLLASQGKTTADDTPFPLSSVIDSNGVEDAIWCLRVEPVSERIVRLFAVWCARQVQHLMQDPRSIAALDAAESRARGEATQQELDAADAAYARAAVRAAAYAAAYAGAYAGAAIRAAQAIKLRQILDAGEWVEDEPCK